MINKILIFGGSGMVGSRFLELNKDKFDISAPEAQEVDILNRDQVFQYIQKISPQLIINFAAYTNVQGAEKEKGEKKGLCYRLNVEGAENVALGSKKIGVKLIHISTDYVFDGSKKIGFYIEDDKPSPINWYGQTKYEGEEVVGRCGVEFVIARISMPYVAHHDLKKDVARFFLDQLKSNRQVFAISDQKITPTLGDDIVKALAVISETVIKKTNRSNKYNISVTDDTTPFDFATMIGKIFNLDTELIKPISLDEYNKDKAAKLLRYSRLNPAKFINEFGNNILHKVEDNVNLFKDQVEQS